MTEYTKPRLIEPGAKYFFGSTLKQCHMVKEKYYNYLFNISCFVLFFSILGLILFFKYKGQQNELEKNIKECKKHKYILEKIRSMKNIQNENSMNLITNLPV